MEIKFRPFVYAGGKKLFYIPVSSSKVIDVRDVSRFNKIERLEDKKVEYNGLVYMSSRIAHFEVLERPIPVHFNIIRNYTSKLINVIRAIKPLFILSCDNDDTTYIKMTMLDDFKEPKIKLSSILTTKDVSCYKVRNKVLDLVYEYYDRFYERDNESVFGLGN